MRHKLNHLPPVDKTSLKQIRIAAIGVLTALCMMSCDCGDSVEDADTYIPSPPDYTLEEMWVKSLNDIDDTGADVFYIPSTWEYDWTTTDGRVCHYADTYNPDHRDDMKTEMNGVAEYMADGNNFYSPVYRHITLDTWATLDEDYIASLYFEVSFPDVERAFNHFLSSRTPGRPLIIAGFSQGAKSVVELLKRLPREAKEDLVAAYVLGYKVTPDDRLMAPWIKGAERDDDIGVTICYNSVSDVKYTKPIVAAPNTMAINPVNWRTDATPAILNDTITVTLSPEAKVLVLEGFDGSYLPNILGILNTGDYHGIEPWVYSECLRQNFKVRTRAFRETAHR